jgi:DNA ligase-1
VKENVPSNIGPPKDITKLRPPSSASYDPVEDAPFYKG